MKDLRSFLSYLGARGECADVKSPVNVEYEVQAHVRKSADTDGPAFLFNNPEPHPEVVDREILSGFRIAAGVFGTAKRVKHAMEFCKGRTLEDLEVMREYMHATRNPIPAKRVKLDIDAPCQQVVVEGEDVNLYDLPICTSSGDDRGPFITGGVQVVRSIKTDVHGLGIHRMNIIDGTHLSCMATKERRVGHFVAHAHEEKKVAQLAVIIGGSPADVLGSMGRVPHDQEKYGITGALLGKPATLVKCKTIDVWVPFDAEMVIECEVPYPMEYHEDVPFTEFTGCSNIKGEAFVCKVKAVTMRKDNPIYLHMSTGMPPNLDDHSLCGLGISSMLFDRAASGCSEILDLCMDYDGNNIFTAHVKIKRRTFGETRNLIYQLLSDINIKYVYIYDDDIDIRDHRDRFWAFETRLRPNEDIYTTDIMVGASLDPSCPGPFRHTAKAGFDCTVPWGKDEEERAFNTRQHAKCWVPGVDEVDAFWLK